MAGCAPSNHQATIVNVLDFRHPRRDTTRFLMSEHAVARNGGGICRDVLAIIVSCRGTGPKALLEPPVSATLKPHPALTALLGTPRRGGTWRLTANGFQQALASIDPQLFAVGTLASFLRCKPQRRTERVEAFAEETGIDFTATATPMASSSRRDTTEQPRTGPGWLTLTTDGTHIIVSVDIGTVTVGPLSKRRSHCDTLELDDLDNLLDAAAAADILCFEQGAGGKLGELRGWQGEIAALRQSSTPHHVDLHLDASTTGTGIGTQHNDSGPGDDPDSGNRHTPHGGWQGQIATAFVVDTVEQLSTRGIETIADDCVVDCVAMSESRPVGRNGLFAHQDSAVSRYTASRRGMILAFDPGAGKTPTACVALAESLTGGGRAAVVAPRTVCPQWEQELTLWTSVPFTCWKPGGPLPHTGVILCAANDAAQLADLVEQTDSTFTDLVIDEARFLRTRTQQTRACERLRSRAERCLLLSATPARRQVGDYARLLTFARGERWDPAAFNTAGKHNLDFLDPLVVHGTLPEARQIFFHTQRTSRVDDSTHVDELRELLGELRTIETRPTQGSALAVGSERRKNRGHTLLRIEHVTTHMSNLWSEVNTHDIVDTIISTATPALVFVKSPKTRTAVADMLCEKGVSTRILDQAKNAEATARDFQKGVCDVLVVGAAGEEGLNLTRARRVLIGDTPFEPAVLRQRVGRAARIGHDGTALDVHFFAPSAAAARAVRALIRAAGQPVADGGALGVAAACCAL